MTAMTSLLKIQEPSTQKSLHRASLNAFLELGFRPLYACAAGWACVAVSLWVFAPQLLQGEMTGVFWHAHEMLWGFIACTTAGFLLTATNNWTGINPLQGLGLGALALLWLAARIGFLLPGSSAFWLASAADLLFVAVAAAAIARCLLIRKSKHNYMLAVLLLGIGAANAAYLYACWQQRDYATVMHSFVTGMLCMAVIALLIAGRVIPFFASRVIPAFEYRNHTRCKQAQAMLAICAIIGWQFGADRWAALLLASAGLIALWQLTTWHPILVRSSPLLWVLYLGYAGLGLGLCVAAIYLAGFATRMSWTVHTLGIAGFGTLMIGMMTRTALGHTGRLLAADHSMVWSYWLVAFAAVLRLAALADSQHPLLWIYFSATCWVLAFGLYLWRFIPFLIRPRADQRYGKPISISRKPPQNAPHHTH